MTESLGFNYELTEFSGESPIFPLPNTVFFPKTLLPLHIFEERYKEMVRDVLTGERIICVTLLKEGWEEDYFEKPQIFTTGTIGYVEKFKRLEDGKFNILLNGLSKVEIHELPQKMPYRRGEMEILQDSTSGGNLREEREALLRQFRKIAQMTEADFPIEDILSEDVPLEMLVNLLTTWLPITTEDKQKLLEIQNIPIRSEIVREYLRQEIKDLGFLDDLDIMIPDNPRWN
ncbi:MAG: LON peptidase substrate-binding domain-containing protein [Candidatus Marinimicrobia bacterium]|nr:LON peptidase substrate-binding domain-containing protein [Candidatus Neomarinimicrobiota bacterium]MCF7829203.1 LON peptidase substrate-binding domain-containing protein [Candidatus Neomarinimicrobiota bacterium]MCF7881144.1 LON peptidase substrate-binding domain-containing protein [Candidatus Neomarinimicrobiota bacterium]